MKNLSATLLAPPLTAYRYGCNPTCASLIGMFWGAGVTATIYGYAGGPLALAFIDWPTVALGISMWLISAMWSLIILQSSNDLLQHRFPPPKTDSYADDPLATVHYQLSLPRLQYKRYDLLRRHHLWLTSLVSKYSPQQNVHAPH